MLVPLHLPWILYSNPSLCLYVFQGPSSSPLKLLWTTSQPLWATQPSFTAVCQETHCLLCAGWRTMLQWCRSPGGSRTGPHLTDHASASETWTLPTQATFNVWPLTPRAPCPQLGCCLSNSVRQSHIIGSSFMTSVITCVSFSVHLFSLPLATLF